METPGVSLTTDAELVRRCLDGEEGAWADLTDRYLRLVVRVAQRAGLDADRASDAAQETFLALWRNLRRLRDTRSLGGWLATTCRRRAWRLGKRDASRRAREEGVSVRDVAAEPLPESVLVDEEQRHLVRRAFVTIGERCRRLLDALFFRPEMPYAEISEEVGMPVGSIGPTRKRCLDRLRRSLADAGISHSDVSADMYGGSTSSTRDPKRGRTP